jgi:NitT/TauT family transport system permease protein
MVKFLLPYAFSALALGALLWLANQSLGPGLAPGPLAIMGAWKELVLSGELFRELGITVLRGLTGVLLANIAGVALGLAAGLIPSLLRLTAPLVAALQSCPPVVWISLVMVWAGTGSAVPVATVFAASLPFAFSTTAQGIMGLNRRIFAMSKLYGVPRGRQLRQFILPGILPVWLGGFSAVLSAGWKSAAVAEFLGSHQGIGAKIFWSYHKLDMEALNAWALTLIVLGVILETAVITPLRRQAAQLESRGAFSNV